MIVRLNMVGMAFMCVAAIACGDPPSAPEATVQLELVGVDTFWIQDTGINPGCHYDWVMRATGDASASAELIGGRIMRSWDLAAVPADTFYLWTAETIKPLFGGSATFGADEERESGSYATMQRDMPPNRNRVEFDYLVHPAESRHVVSGDFFCLRK